MDRTDIERIVRAQGVTPSFWERRNHSHRAKEPSSLLVNVFRRCEDAPGGHTSYWLGKFSDLAVMSEEQLVAHIAAKTGQRKALNGSE